MNKKYLITGIFIIILMLNVNAIIPIMNSYGSEERKLRNINLMTNNLTNTTCIFFNNNEILCGNETVIDTNLYLIWNSTSKYIVNSTGLLDVNETILNISIQAITDNLNIPVDISDLTWDDDWMIAYSDNDGLVQLPFNDDAFKFLMSNGEGALSWEVPNETNIDEAIINISNNQDDIQNLNNSINLIENYTHPENITLKNIYLNETQSPDSGISAHYYLTQPILSSSTNRTGFYFQNNVCDAGYNYEEFLVYYDHNCAMTDGSLDVGFQMRYNDSDWGNLQFDSNIKGFTFNAKSGNTKVTSAINKKMSLGTASYSWDNCYCDDYYTTSRGWLSTTSTDSAIEIISNIKTLESGDFTIE